MKRPWVSKVISGFAADLAAELVERVRHRLQAGAKPCADLRLLLPARGRNGFIGEDQPRQMVAEQPPRLPGGGRMGREGGEMRLEVAEALEDPVELRPAVERKRLAPGEQPVLGVARQLGQLGLGEIAVGRAPARRPEERCRPPAAGRRRRPPPAPAPASGATSAPTPRMAAPEAPPTRRPASSGASASRDWRSLAPLLRRAHRLRLHVAAEIFVRLPEQADDIEAHHSSPGPPSSL